MTAVAVMGLVMEAMRKGESGFALPKARSKTSPFCSTRRTAARSWPEATAFSRTVSAALKRPGPKRAAAKRARRERSGVVTVAIILQIRWRELTAIDSNFDPHALIAQMNLP